MLGLNAVTYRVDSMKIEMCFFQIHVLNFTSTPNQQLDQKRALNLPLHSYNKMQLQPWVPVDHQGLHSSICNKLAKYSVHFEACIE